MARRVGRRAHEFAEHVAQVVAEVGGDRTVSEDSTIHRSVWHDTKTGRTLPHPERTWPAMRAYLEQARPRVRWDGLYDAARAERERAATQGNGSARPARARPRVLAGDRASLRAPVAAVSRAGLLDAAVAQRDRHARGAGRRQILALVGEGGIGKSVLLGQYLDRLDVHAEEAVVLVACGNVGRAADLSDSASVDRTLGAVVDPRFGRAGLLHLLEELRTTYSAVTLLIDTVDLLLGPETATASLSSSVRRSMSPRWS